MTCAELSDRGRASSHAVIGGLRRFAAVEFDGPSRRVRRPVSMFADGRTAELFAVEQGWDDYAVGPAVIVLGLRE